MLVSASHERGQNKVKESWWADAISAEYATISSTTVICRVLVQYCSIHGPCFLSNTQRRGFPVLVSDFLLRKQCQSDGHGTMRAEMKTLPFRGLKGRKFLWLIMSKRERKMTEYLPTSLNYSQHLFQNHVP